MAMKTTKTRIRQALQATEAGRVRKRTFAEVVAKINALLAANLPDSVSGYRFLIPIITALLWSQGFATDEAVKAAQKLIEAAE